MIERHPLNPVTTEVFDLQDQNVHFPSIHFISSFASSPLKRWILRWSELTLPLACALAALENIPSLSSRSVLSARGVMKLFKCAALPDSLTLGMRSRSRCRVGVMRQLLNSSSWQPPHFDDSPPGFDSKPNSQRAAYLLSCRELNEKIDTTHRDWNVKLRLTADRLGSEAKTAEQKSRKSSRGFLINFNLQKRKKWKSENLITAPHFSPPRLSASCSAKLIACGLQFVFSNLIFQPNFRLETLEFCSFALLAEQQLQSLQPRRRHTFPDIPSCCFCNNTVLGRKVFRHRESDLKSQITLSNIWGKYVSCIRQTQANANVFILYLLLTWKKNGKT